MKGGSKMTVNEAIEVLKKRSAWIKQHFEESTHAEAIDTVVEHYETKTYTAKDMETFAEWLIGRSADWITDEERCETAETFIEMWEKERCVNTSKPPNSKQQCPTCGSDSLITLSDITYCMNDCCDGVKGHN